MNNWIVTGASGSLATACIQELLQEGKSVSAYSRNPLQYHDPRIISHQVDSYQSVNLNSSNSEGLLVAQGFFHYELFEHTSPQELTDLLDGNFLSQIQVVQSFLQASDKSQRIDIVILGSTSAFEAGKGTVVYGTAKAAMLAFVRAMNKEYNDTDIRFWFISTGTLANAMGAKVPNQDPTSLLDVRLVAKEIVETVTNGSNMWQPEITIRRRHIKTVS